MAVLARAIADFYATGREDGFASYSDTCLRRIWQGERFSWFMTSMLHRFPADGPFGTRLQLAQLEQVVSSPAAATALSESYVGCRFSESLRRRWASLKRRAGRQTRPSSSHPFGGASA